MEKFTGKVWVLGDDIDTDIIIPTEYLALKTVNDMKPFAFSPLRPELAGQIQEGDIIVAGKNFGCGSSREQAPVAIKTAGVDAIVAKSFARIFYRNAINIGLPVIVCDIQAKDGDIINIDLSKGILTNETTGESVTFEPFKEFMLDILEDNGLVNHYLKEKQ